MSTNRVRSRLAIFALLGLFAAAASGCGWFFTHGPPAGHQSMSSFSCTESPAGPVLDGIGFVWFTINGQINAQHGYVAATAIDAGLTVALVWSAFDGAMKVRNCRAAQAQLAARLAAGAQQGAPQPGTVPSAAVRPTPPPVAVPHVVRAVTVSPAADTVKVRQVLQLAATARDANAAIVPGVTFIWSSSDTAVAVVTGAGLVTARRVGVALVTARADSVTGQARVVVRRR